MMNNVIPLFKSHFSIGKSILTLKPESEVDKCVDAFLERQCLQDNWGQKYAFKSKNECISKFGNEG